MMIWFWSPAWWVRVSAKWSLTAPSLVRQRSMTLIASPPPEVSLYLTCKEIYGDQVLTGGFVADGTVCGWAGDF
ncbi:hypothetical protein [Kitasatospora sp. MAP5-34]|uniref:hypothetical protein n=1 Tax=Kitasatospora sp. MAP5-34 TaxID=3035102 RepID=UPI002474B46B|nr:hypothetical protein [Kitasatospora sp. MAP5-34]